MVKVKVNKLVWKQLKPGKYRMKAKVKKVKHKDYKRMLTSL